MAHSTQSHILLWYFAIFVIVLCAEFFLNHKFVMQYSIAVHSKVPSTLQYKEKPNEKYKTKPRSLATDSNTKEIRKEEKSLKYYDYQIEDIYF